MSGVARRAATRPAVMVFYSSGHDELYSGRWLARLDAVLAQPEPPERPR